MNGCFYLEDINSYLNYLEREEKSAKTIEKYGYHLRLFYNSLPPGKTASKEAVIAWKEGLTQKYAVSTVNGIIAALNGFFTFIGRPDCRVKPLKTQRKVFRDASKELNAKEFDRLMLAAKSEGSLRLYFLLETLAYSGIRISELPFITVEALTTGRAFVRNKGKIREVILHRKLQRDLRQYCRNHGIHSGPVFITKRGRPVDRSNVWRELKRLCAKAKVDASKVFPHNFRHFFAVSFYNAARDIAKLADLLGHASIETTRIYIMESGDVHARLLNQMNLKL